MSIIKIAGRSTATTIEKLKEMLNSGEIIPGNFYAVHLRYNAHHGLGDIDTTEFYPVKFKGIRNQELWLPYVTMGYGGEGPHGTQTALKLMGFDAVAANEQLIFGQKVVDETFFKEASEDDRIEYHFDAMYATSEHLKRLVNAGITEDSIKLFENVAFELRWEGKHARRFRSVVSDIADELRFRSVTESDTAYLMDIADYPRKCADAMAAKEKEIANMIGKINSTFNG